MADINSSFRCLRTSSVSVANFSTNERSSMPTLRRSSGSLSGWPIQYKTIHERGTKGAWGGYKTQEEFMNMHFR